MIGANNGRVPGKDQQCTGTDRHLDLQGDSAPMPTEQRDDLRRKYGVPHHLRWE